MTDHKAKAADAPEKHVEIPAGKARVVIAADFKNPNRVGKTVTLDAEEARVMVAEGRARYHRDHTATQSTPAALPVTTVVAPPSATA